MWKHNKAFTRTSQELALAWSIVWSTVSIISDEAGNNRFSPDAEPSVHFCLQPFNDFLFSSDQGVCYHFSSHNLDLLTSVRL